MKTENHPMNKDGKPLQEVKKILGICSKKFDQIEAVHTAVQINGRGYYSVKDVEAAKKTCDDIWKLNQSVEKYLNNLKRTAALPIIPEAP